MNKFGETGKVLDKDFAHKIQWMKFGAWMNATCSIMVLIAQSGYRLNKKDPVVLQAQPNKVCRYLAQQMYSMGG